MPVRIVDHSARFTARLLAHMDRNTARAAEEFRRQVMQEITGTRGSNNDDEFITVWVGGYPVSRRIRWVKPYSHSAPYRPPYTVTGQLARSYAAWKVGTNHHRVGSDDPNALWQEFGTRCQAPRPHLRRTLVLRRRPIANEWCRPL